MTTQCHNKNNNKCRHLRTMFTFTDPEMSDKCCDLTADTLYLTFIYLFYVYFYDYLLLLFKVDYIFK